MRPAPTAHAGALELEYLGTAGWQLTAGSHVLLVDPYFSRLPIDDDTAPLLPDTEAIARYAPRSADAVLVTHSHYDHLLDVPEIAKHTGARVVGTVSSANVARAAGVPEPEISVVHGGEELALGPFSVRVLRGLHALIDRKNEPIPANVSLPLSARGYAEGDTLQYLVRVAGHTILFMGSANFSDSELAGLRPDIAVVAVKLRARVPDYSCRLMRALGNPPLVLANHFDAHREPLGPLQMSISPKARTSLDRFAAEVHACAPRTTVIVPRHFQAIVP